MTYSCRYKSNPSFPYSKNTYTKKSNKSNSKKTHKEEEKEEKKASIFDNSLFRSILDPIEKLLGRKIEFDDILIVALIYIIFTEKSSENNTLLMCLVFILLS